MSYGEKVNNDQPLLVFMQKIFPASVAAETLRNIGLNNSPPICYTSMQGTICGAVNTG